MLSAAEVAEIALAGATTLMAGLTGWLAFATHRLEKAWFRTSAEQIGVNTWLALELRFDSEEMKRARKRLATHLKVYASARHDKISETVLNFFESVGIAYKEGYLNKKLAESSFSFHACRWWEASKPYVDHEQKRHGEDTTLFEDFKDLAKAMRLPGEVLDEKEIQQFLEDELKLE